MQHQNELTEALGVQQARMDQAAREESIRRTEASRKRALPEVFGDPLYFKKPKMEPQATPVSGPNVLASFDFTTLPHSLVTNLVIANLVAVSQTRLDTAIQVRRRRQFYEYS